MQQKEVDVTIICTSLIYRLKRLVNAKSISCCLQSQMRTEIMPSKLVKVEYILVQSISPGFYLLFLYVQIYYISNLNYICIYLEFVSWQRGDLFKFKILLRKVKRKWGRKYWRKVSVQDLNRVLLCYTVYCAVLVLSDDGNKINKRCLKKDLSFQIA